VEFGKLKIVPQRWQLSIFDQGFSSSFFALRPII